MATKLNALHCELLAEINRAKGRWRNGELTSFAGMKGSKGGGGFLVIGRAVNSWETRFKAEELVENRLREVLSETFAPNRWYKNDPTLWVSDCWKAKKPDYSTKRSAFWRVAREVIKQLEIADVTESGWPSHLAWSNLYKISPASGGNPSGALMEVQREKCFEILKEEITMWNPERVLFQTGYCWAEPFLKYLGFIRADRKAGKPVEARGHIFNGAVVAVGPHPQGKREKPLVDSLCMVLKSPNQPLQRTSR